MLVLWLQTWRNKINPIKINSVVSKPKISIAYFDIKRKALYPNKKSQEIQDQLKDKSQEIHYSIYKFKLRSIKG